MFGETVDLIWTANHSQIYTTLYQLEKDGLLTKEVVIQDHKPNKKIYRCDLRPDFSFFRN